VQAGGIILITTRSVGFPYHGYPYDFWRFEISDMKNIFSDCEILALGRDPSEPGVFIKVRKPEDFNELDLSDYALYSIILNKKVKNIEEKDFEKTYFKYITFKYRFIRVLNKSLRVIVRVINNLEKKLFK